MQGRRALGAAVAGATTASAAAAAGCWRDDLGLAGVGAHEIARGDNGRATGWTAVAGVEEGAFLLD